LLAWLGFKFAGLGPELGLTVLWEGLIALPLLAISLFRPTGFGMGDVKAVALVTLFLGERVLVVVVAACFLSLLAALVRRVWVVEGLPFVPFLTAGAMATLSS
jgi:prepilin signal peptidase PulO-like enzyme (type II secretory pathway)